MGYWARRFGACIGALLLVACSHTNVKTATAANFSWSGADKRLVLIDPDVELSELSAAGVGQARADWTAEAKRLIAQHVSTTLAEKQISLVPANAITEAKEIQLVRLHGTVGQAVLTHLYNPALKLPNKGDALDWTLGPGANALREHYGADYALFVFVRDSYTSAARALVMLGAAAFGVGLQGGQQIGFASLVDLRTGNIVWFNQLRSATGDLRTEEPAKSVVDNLIKDLPV